jgi:S1-C subfamily serine protease
MSYRPRKSGYLWILVAGLVLFGCWGSAVSSALGNEQLLSKSVVLIRGVSQDWNYSMPWKQTAMSQGSGTGFVIDGKRILTNAHNVSNNKYVEIKKQGQARRYPARVAFIGHDCDLAILLPQEMSFFDDTEPLELGGIPEVNTTVSTYGFPVGGELVSVTEGIVSRVEMDNYSHTGADSHLVVQTDAAINPGNSGGPVIQKGKVVGVAFQGLLQADNIGYMIPTTVIRHFLADITDDMYDGFGSLGFTFYPGLHSASYKEYLKIPDQEEGIVVLQTLLNGSIETILQPGDVLTKIDQYDVDNDGKILIDDLRLQISEVVERKQIGDQVEITFYRDGQIHTEKVEVRLNRPVLGYARQYDKKPDYVVYVGLTFVPVSRNFLETWGSNWLPDVPHPMRYLFYYSQQLNQQHQRLEYVVLGEILPDEVNQYCGKFKYQPVEKINGMDIWSLADVKKAIENPDGNFCMINFMYLDWPLIIDLEKGQTRHNAILQQYQVPADARISDAN